MDYLVKKNGIESYFVLGIIIKDSRIVYYTCKYEIQKLYIYTNNGASSLGFKAWSSRN
jgi:hypothetical protein